MRSLFSLHNAIDDAINTNKTKRLAENGKIKIKPLGRLFVSSPRRIGAHIAKAQPAGMK